MGICEGMRGFRPAIVPLGLALVLAGCQSNSTANVSDLASAGQAEVAREDYTLEELGAYCPEVGLREGTSTYRSYQRGGEGDASKLTYLASIADVTRRCSYEGGNIRMNVAVAGRVVPGPVGTSGTVTMPIRVAAIQGDQVIYSELHQFEVAVADTAGATQFVFNDRNISFPMPSTRNVRIFAGYDEGPYGTQ